MVGLWCCGVVVLCVWWMLLNDDGVCDVCGDDGNVVCDVDDVGGDVSDDGGESVVLIDDGLFMFKFLILLSVVGSVIGKGGVMINEF